MSDKALTRQGWFALLCSKTDGHEPLIEDHDFGLFLERKTGMTSPFDINEVFKFHFKVSSKADIKTGELSKFIGEFMATRDTL